MNETQLAELVARVTDEAVGPIRKAANEAVAEANARAVEVAKAYEEIRKSRDEMVTVLNEAVDVLKSHDELKVIAATVARRLDTIERAFTVSKQASGQDFGNGNGHVDRGVDSAFLAAVREPRS
jgi:hypothetical protein